MSKTLDELQRQVDQAVNTHDKPYWHPLSQLAHLIEEVGEISRIVNDQYGDKPKKAEEEHDELGDELADLLFGIICMANSEGIKLDEPLQRSINKVLTRDKDRFNQR